MIKIETKKVSVIYCDYCKEPITDYSYSILELPDSVKHFHNMYTGEPTCLELYQKLRSD